MKAHYTTFLFFICLLIAEMHSPINATETREILISDSYTGKGIDSVLVRMWHNNQLVDSVHTNSSGQCFINMLATSFSEDQSVFISSPYPNPFSEETYIPLNISHPQTINTSLYNLKGTVLIHKNFNISQSSVTLKVFMSNYPPGIYFLKISGTHQNTVRLIKNGIRNSQKQVTIQLSENPIGNDHSKLKSSEDVYVLKAEKNPYQTFEKTISPTSFSNLEISMERNNSVEILVKGTFRDEIEKHILIEGEGFSNTFTSPGSIVLKSGHYRITANYDSTSAINESIEIPSKDTLFVIKVDNVDELLTPRQVMVSTNDNFKATGFFEAGNGGSLSVNDEAGNQYILEIPPGSLFYDEDITLSFISGIEDFPFSGGFISGIDIQPKGLQLSSQAVLRYIPSEAIPDEAFYEDDSGYAITGFGYSFSGENFHIHPFHQNNDEITFLISHFSGIGIGKANESDKTSQQRHHPDDNNAIANQQINQILDDYRERKKEDPKAQLTEEDKAELTAIIRRWFYNSTEPMLKDAMTNENIFPCAFIEFANWNVALLTLWETLDYPLPLPLLTEQDNGNKMLRTALYYAKDRRMQMAVDNFDIRQFHHIVDLGTINLGMLGGDGFDREIENLLRFEVEFESEIQNKDTWTVGVKTERFVAQFLFSTTGFTSGEGAIYHSDAWFDCMINFQGSGDIFKVLALEVIIPRPEDLTCGNRSIGGQQDHPLTPNINMLFLPGVPMETFTIQCEEEDTPFTLGPMPQWYGSFGHLHESSIIENIGFLFNDWEVFMGELFARKNLTRTDGDLSENTMITVWYSPLP